MFITTREIVSYLIPLHARGKALDVGAGTAKYKNTIMRHVSSYETLDVHPGPAIDHVGDARKMGFAGSSFDTILCFQTLEHVDRPDQAVKEFFRILKPGGAVIATMPFIAPQHADPSDYWRYSVSGARTLFEYAGLSIVECKGYAGIFSIAGEFLKFSFLNPYSGKAYGKIRTKTVVALMRMLWWIDRRFENWKVQKDFYPNVYIVAKKPR